VEEKVIFSQTFTCLLDIRYSPGASTDQRFCVIQNFFGHLQPCTFKRRLCLQRFFCYN